MSIPFTCPHCGHSTQVDVQYAGQSGPCVQCGQTVTMPSMAIPVQPKMGDDMAIRMLIPVGRSPWAIIAGYLGLFSPIVIFAPFAILVGIIAIFHIRRNPGTHGMGRAIFGIVMGILVLLAVLVSFLWMSRMGHTV